MPFTGTAFDTETLDLPRSVLDEAWSSLRPHEQQQSAKSVLAQRILKLAAKGERDRKRLYYAAMRAAVISAL
jgi:hypothetical protein